MYDIGWQIYLYSWCLCVCGGDVDVCGGGDVDVCVGGDVYIRTNVDQN